MSFDPEKLRLAIAAKGRVVRVVVAETKGSTPREVGADMLVWKDGQSGTIGGGALEYEAARTAREMLDKGGTKLVRQALGPALEQCCGGAVTLVFDVFSSSDMDRLSEVRERYARPVLSQADKTAPASLGLDAGWLVEPVYRPENRVWIWGAGHVGHALARTLSPLPGFAVTVVDTDPARLAGLAEGADPLAASRLPDMIRHAPSGAHHFVMTYSHALDLDLCHGLLRHGAIHIGLIGSATKWARFRKRLSDLGHAEREIDRIRCPIGDPALGKSPQAIAVGVAHGLLVEQTPALRDRERLI